MFHLEENQLYWFVGLGQLPLVMNRPIYACEYHVKEEAHGKINKNIKVWKIYWQTLQK